MAGDERPDDRRNTDRRIHTLAWIPTLLVLRLGILLGWLFEGRKRDERDERYKTMNIFIINVTKRENAGTKDVIAIMGNAIAEHLHDRDTAGIINDWIAESRENSRVERLFFVGKNQRSKASENIPKNGLFGI